MHINLSEHFTYGKLIRFTLVPKDGESFQPYSFVISLRFAALASEEGS